MSFQRTLAPRTIATVLAASPMALLIACSAAFVIWTFVLSLTDSHLLPQYHFVGWRQYHRLFATPRWWETTRNLAEYLFCFIGGSVLLGYLLAILIDRGMRYRALICTLFMLPLSLSFVVTGIVWFWLLNPSLGLEHAVRALGWRDFHFDWIVRTDRAIFAVAVAAIWQQAGICMALFLAGLRDLDPNLWRVAALDAVPTWRFYARVITPALGTTFSMAIVLLFSTGIKTFDLVETLTGGGPGFASDLPARYIVELISRQELAMGAAGATALLGVAAIVIGPYACLAVNRRRLS